MAQRCTVCDHAKRAEIDRVLVEGRTTPAALAKRYRLVGRSVQRHAHKHLPAALAAARDVAETVRGGDLLARLLTYTADTETILAAAKKAKDYEIALKAIGRLEKQVELQAKLLGELRDGPTVNVFVGAEWQQALAVILGVLRPHPALRAEIGAALKTLAAGQDGQEGQEVGRAA